MKHEGLIVGLLVVTVVCSAAALALGVVRGPRASKVVAATGTAQSRLYQIPPMWTWVSRRMLRQYRRLNRTTW